MPGTLKSNPYRPPEREKALRVEPPRKTLHDFFVIFFVMLSMGIAVVFLLGWWLI